MSLDKPAHAACHSDAATEKNKAVWACRRGLLELDLLLGAFIAQHWDRLTKAQKTKFHTLLAHEDTQLQKWLIYQIQDDLPVDMTDLIGKIRTGGR